MEPKLGNQIRKNFQEVIDPRLVAILQEQLEPITKDLAESRNLATQHHGALISKLVMTQSSPLPYETGLQSEYEAIITNFQSLEVSQNVAVDTIKEHIHGAIEGLKNDHLQVGRNIISRRMQLANTRKRQSPLDQPLQNLGEISKHQTIDPGSLEDL